MASTNPLTDILNQDKLVGENYVDWKRKLTIVLTLEGHKFVLDEACPPKPTDETSKEDKDYYKQWLRSDKLARYTMLATMSNVLRYQYRNVETAAEVMTSLEELFSHQNHMAKSNTMMEMLSLKMAEGTPVRDHVLKMMGYLNQIEKLGAEFDTVTQVDFILHSLPASFQQFRLNYIMNNKMYTLVELLQALTLAEMLLMPKRQASVSAGPCSSKPKGKKKNKTDGQQQGDPKDKGKALIVGGVKKENGKGKCFNCGEKGHWRSACPQPKIKGKKKGILANPTT